MPATIISTVWEHFDVFDDKSFRCKVDNCDLLFNPPLRSTTAMRHLSRKHKEVHDEVLRKEEARKGGMAEEEASANENEPAQKKKRVDEEAMPSTMPSSKENTKKVTTKAVPNSGHIGQVLQSSSTYNVQPALPDPSPATHHDALDSSAAEEIMDGTTWAQSMVQQLLDTGVIKTLPRDAPKTNKAAGAGAVTSMQEPAVQKNLKVKPKEAPTTSKYAEASYPAGAEEALPSASEKTESLGAKVKRQAAIEAEKRIARLNDWLYRARKENKVVQAKRTTARNDQNMENEDDDVSYPVDSILDERWIAGKRQVRLRWTGYDDNADSWEPVEHLDGAAELLAAFDAGMDDGFDEDLMDEE